MVKLDKATIAFICEDINSPKKIKERKEDYIRWLMFNGKTKEVIQETIRNEFKRQETVDELLGRLVPINIVQKVINKLSGIYTEDPLREAVDENEADEDLITQYEEGMRLNQLQKEANRYFKLFKRNLKEIYLNEDGVPSARNLPRHTYEVYSFNKKTPNKPNVIAKLLVLDPVRDKQVIALWSDEQHYIVNGNGVILMDKMIAMENAEGVNPYKKMPFVYTTESSYSVDPLPDDDLVSVAVAIPLVLTDLLFACKYQCWSIIYTIGDVGDIPGNPSSILSLNFGPDGQIPQVGTIKPEVDILAIIQLITNILQMLLTTKNLSVGTITTTSTSASEAVSGISKMLDQAESVEDKKDQQQFFYDAEVEMFCLLKDYLIPEWRKQSNLNPDYNKEFSTAFKLSITFRQPKPMITEEAQINNSWNRLKYGFSTLERELRELYPTLKDTQIEQLRKDILDEREEMAARQITYMEAENNALNNKSKTSNN